MTNPLESGMPKPLKKDKEVPCPQCGEIVRQTIFTFQKMALPMMDCTKCGYSEDGLTIHINDSQN